MKRKVIRYREDVNQRRFLIEYGEKIGEERVYMGKSGDPEDKVTKYYAEESFPENNLAATIEIYTKDDMEEIKIYKNEDGYTCDNLSGNQIFGNLEDGEAFLIKEEGAEEDEGEDIKDWDDEGDLYLIYYEGI